MHNTHEQWLSYCARERAALDPVLTALGYTLAAEQPHISGERYLMSAVTTTSGPKLILLGTRNSDGMRVVIKATSDPAGKRELIHERNCRELLGSIDFAYETFSFPEEIMFIERGGLLISIHAFIEHDMPFLERPIEKQFSIALTAFKAQESAHATTYRHLKRIERVFEHRGADDYINRFTLFRENIEKVLPDATELAPVLAASLKQLEASRERIEQYCCFLTHVDFVPHNFRIKDGTIYLLDASSLCFGNKYEGWARFVNFMELHNPALAAALVQYVRDNRAPEEMETLHLMRIYRLGEIIWFYTRLLERTGGDMHTLTDKRVQLWSAVLEAALHDTVVSPKILDTYKKERDELRSEEEKKRQVGLY